MGSAVINGIQYYDESEGVPARAAACMKHFIAYSFPMNGHDRAPVQLPDRVLKQLYMPSFQAAIDSNVLTAMESYQEVTYNSAPRSRANYKNLFLCPLFCRSEAFQWSALRLT
jgi:beta-glucosidase